jgi:hypothetical protein
MKKLPKEEMREIVSFLKRCGAVCEIKQDNKVSFLAGIDWTNKRNPILVINPRKWSSLFLTNIDLKNKNVGSENKLHQSHKGILLHEIGHLKTDKGWKEARSLKEYRAQKWAIEYSSKNGWDDLVKLGASHIRFWNKFCSYHSGDRIYKMAYKLMAKDRKWTKKYGITI